MQFEIAVVHCVPLIADSFEVIGTKVGGVSNSNAAPMGSPKVSGIEVDTEGCTAAPPPQVAELSPDPPGLRRLYATSGAAFAYGAGGSC